MRPRTGAGKLDCHAALVWAWTEDGQGRRTDLGDKSPKLSISDFAALNIRGLSSRDFCDWWAANVSVRHGMNRHTQESAVRGSLPVEQAEQATGITHQQVSRWAKALEDRGKQGGSRFAEFAKARFGMDKRRAQEWAGIGSEYKELSVIVGQFGADYRAFYEFTRLTVAL